MSIYNIPTKEEELNPTQHKQAVWLSKKIMAFKAWLYFGFNVFFAGMLLALTINSSANDFIKYILGILVVFYSLFQMQDYLAKLKKIKEGTQ